MGCVLLVRITQPIICLLVKPSFLIPSFLRPASCFPGFHFPRSGFPWTHAPSSFCTNPSMCFANSTILCWFGILDPAMRFANSTILRWFGTLDPVMCFANSSILCRLSTYDPAFVLRQFYDSMLVPYFYDPASVRSANSTILCWWRSWDCTSCSGALPILRFYAGIWFFNGFR